MPAISVIVPVYKVEKYIHRCVDSILGQSYVDFELILVDDGSPDKCSAICDEYAAKDSRVVVIHQENGGLSAARNAGINWAFGNSDSQWLTFIDSDDWVHSEYLKHLLDAAVKYNVAVSICGYVETEGDALDIDADSSNLKKWSSEDFYVEHNVNATVAWGKLYKKECFNEIRYPAGRIHEDEFTTYKILFAYENIVVLPVALYYYFSNQEGITKSQWSIKRLDAVDALFLQIQYFFENGFGKAYFMAVKNASWAVMNASSNVITSDLNESSKKKCLLFLRKKMRKLLRRHKKEYPFHKNYAQYEFAFPNLMKLYWLSLVILNKVGLRK